MGDGRLLEMAAAASTSAARSPRLELYPRGMSARRALELSLSSVPTKSAGPEIIREVVQARYPEAAALPEGKELGALLESVGLQQAADPGVYRRKELMTAMQTASILERHATTHTGHRVADHAAGSGKGEVGDLTTELRDGPLLLRVDLDRGPFAQPAKLLAGGGDIRLACLRRHLLGSSCSA